ncbi:hypothetical protein H4217_004313 [Coemansia sp. RSA 1939]|nr:hypothetical protein H4217_004313 [Coemansia sp. RSA 1939]
MSSAGQSADASCYSGQENDDQSLAPMTIAINQAIQVLQQEQSTKQNHSAENEYQGDEYEYNDDDAGIENASEYEYNDEQSMTQEFTQTPSRPERLTLSQVDFDQWMQLHAVLEDDSSINSTAVCSYSSFNQHHGKGEEVENGGQQQHAEEDYKCGMVDVQGAWLKATQNWSSDEHQSMDVDDDIPISIASSESEDDGEYDDVSSTNDPQEYSDSAYQRSGSVDPPAANAALFLAGLADQEAEGVVGKPEETNQSLEDQPYYYEQPPPQSLPPLDEMSRAINESLDRSNELANEIYAICDEVAATALDSSCADHIDKYDTNEVENSTLSCSKSMVQSVDMAKEIANVRTEASAQQDKLKAQLVRLSTEIYQIDAERNSLSKRLSSLERDSCEYQQNMDELEEQVKELNRRLSAKDQELQMATSMLTTAKHERDDLAGKCASLESNIKRLEEKQSLVVDVQKDPLDAPERNTQNHQQCQDKADRMYADVRDQLLKMQSRERLLLSTNRALEARLGDALRKLAGPVESIDILADHRRHWDAQLVEARSEAKTAKEDLICAEQGLENERQTNERLRIRILELESAVGLATVTPRKRKADSYSNPEPLSSTDIAEPMLLDALAATNTPCRSNGDGAASDRQECQQAIVSAGEFARNRRRKLHKPDDTDSVSDAGAVTPIMSRAAVDRRLSSGRTPYRSFTGKPVTPRIHLNHGPTVSPRSASKISSESRLNARKGTFDMKENISGRYVNNSTGDRGRALERRLL